MLGVPLLYLQSSLKPLYPIPETPKPYLEGRTLLLSFSGDGVFYIADPSHKTRSPKKGGDVGPSLLKEPYKPF